MGQELVTGAGRMGMLGLALPIFIPATGHCNLECGQWRGLEREPSPICQRSSLSPLLSLERRCSPEITEVSKPQDNILINLR
jgi:hypothetical protein